MEINGIKVDKKFLKFLSDKFEKKINNLEKEILNYQKKNLILDQPSS